MSNAILTTQAAAAVGDKGRRTGRPKKNKLNVQGAQRASSVPARKAGPGRGRTAQ